VVLDLDVDEHAGARVERLGEGGNARGQVGRRRPANEAAVWQGGIMMDHQPIVAGATYVEFDAVRALRDCEFERLDGVLGRCPRSSPMSDHERHDRQHGSSVQWEEMTRAEPPWAPICFSDEERRSI